MSQQIDIRLKAYDEASKTIAEASSKIKSDMAQVEAANKRVADAQKESLKSSRDLITGMSGVATSAFSLYNAYDRVSDMQLNVDKANLQVKTSTNSVDDARRRVTSTSIALQNAEKATLEATLKFGAGSDKASEAMARQELAQRNNEAAQADLVLSQERLTVAEDRAQQTQDNMNEAMIQSALQVIPTSITMVDSLGKAWKNFPDMTKMLSNTAAKVSEVGVTAKTAALGVAAFMGGFLIADTVLNAIPEDMRAIAGALTATIAAVVAATIAWMAFHGTMTVGVAVPIILAAVGVGIAGVKAAVGMAEGAVVTQPTKAMVGEAGEAEVVLPVSKLSKLISEVSSTKSVLSRGLIERSSVSVSELMHSSVLMGVPHFAEGGIVLQPTLGLLAESGPEAIIPLNQATKTDEFGSGTQYITINPTINIGNISSELDLPRVTDSVSKGVAEALRRRL